MRTADESRAIAQQVISEREPEPTELEKIEGLIEEKANDGQFGVIVPINAASLASITSSLTALGYTVTEEIFEGTGTGAYLISWE